MPTFRQSIEICAYAILCSIGGSVTNYYLGETIHLDMTFLEHLFTAICTFFIAVVYYNIIGFRFTGIKIVFDLFVASFLFGLTLISGIYEHDAINSAIIPAYFLLAVFVICRIDFMDDSDDAI